MKASLTFLIYHLLFAALAALCLAGCTSTGGFTRPSMPSASSMWPGSWFSSPSQQPAPVDAPNPQQQSQKGAVNKPAANEMGANDDPSTFIARMTRGREN